MDELSYPEVAKGAPRPSLVRETGTFSLPAGTERYHIEGCGAALLAIHAGDSISIENIATALFCSTPQASAIFIANAVLPIEGLPAIITNSPP